MAVDHHDQDWRNKLQQADSFSACKRKWYRHLSKRAAVTIILEQRPRLGLSLLMIERAKFASDQWSGQMAFPGGKQDAADTSIYQTAQRELFEELAIGEDQINTLGRLSDINARSHKPMQTSMLITPFICQAAVAINPVCNDEVAGALWVPVSHFNHQNRKVMDWQQRQLPCYLYQGRRIWGLSLMMIDELVGLMQSP